MSWISMPMKFPGRCLVCGGPIRAGERGLWARGVGVKHEGCVESVQITCSVCGRPAGCQQCEFRDSCDIPNVSPSCICKPCSEKTDALGLYRRSVGKKFVVLSGSV